MKIFSRCSSFWLASFLVLHATQAYSEPVIIKKLDATSRIEKVNPLVLKEEFEGSIISAQSNAQYTSGGFKWPWENIIVLRGPNINLVRAVSAPPYNFVFNPRWLSDDSVLFEYGTNDGSNALYSVARWNINTGQVQTLLSNLSWKIIKVSPSGRYIAFIRGGQSFAGSGGRTPTSLCTFDLITRTEKRWGEAEPLIQSVAWMNDDTLLFSLGPSEAEQNAMRPIDRKVKPLEWHPKIYWATLATGEIETLAKDAFQPVPSPDGQWLLSHSYNNPTATGKEKSNVLKSDPTIPQPKPSTYLVLSRANGNEAHLIRTENTLMSRIIWFPDSSGFVLADSRVVGRTDDDDVVSVTLNCYDVKSSKLTRSGSFRYISIGLRQDEPQWRPISVTKDNHYLISEVTLFGKPPENGLMLQRFNLETGASDFLARVGSVTGLDWRE